MGSKKALIVATVASTIDQFCTNDIKVIIQLGYKVHLAANFEKGNNTNETRMKTFIEGLQRSNITIHNLNFQRNPYSLDNIVTYKKLKDLIKLEQYDLIHCHTPVAAMFTRMVARNYRKKGIKLFYTAHGFHFFNKAPLMNWLIYYPIERLLARFTDVLITINKEDYFRARNFKAKRIAYIPGIGIDVQKINNTVIDARLKRKELGIPEDAFILLSVGELNKNKNHETIIKAIAKLNNPNIFYVICGKGSNASYLNKLSQKLGLENKIKLLGFRNDIIEICKSADVFVFPSRREGLGLAALEAMASGLPIVTSNIHGIVDYSIDGITGFSCNPTDIEGFAKAISTLEKDIEMRKRMGKNNLISVQNYEVGNVVEIMRKIYIDELF